MSLNLTCFGRFCNDRQSCNSDIEQNGAGELALDTILLYPGRLESASLTHIDFGPIP